MNDDTKQFGIVGTTIVLCAAMILAAMTYGCHISETTYMQRQDACLERGGNWINHGCLFLRDPSERKP